MTEPAPSVQETLFGDMPDSMATEEPVETTPVETKPVETTVPAEIAPIEGEPVKPVEPVVAPTLTPQQIADLSAAAAFKVAEGQTKPAPEPTPMTTEEFNQAFNVATVTPELMDAFTNVEIPIEQRIAVFDKYGQALVREAVTMALHSIQDSEKRLLAGFSDQIQPLADNLSVSKAEKLKAEFYTVYPDLKPYEQILKEVHGAFVAQGIKFPTNEKAFEAVATRAKELISSVLTSESNPSNPAIAPETKMTTTAVGGKPGTPSGSTPPLSTQERLFGNMPT